jgi:glutamate synthase domain-containing protein 1
MILSLNTTVVASDLSSICSAGKSHSIVEKSLQVLINLQAPRCQGQRDQHRRRAGILLQVPHAFLLEETKKLKIVLPDPGKYGLGMVSLPRDAAERQGCEKLMEEAVQRTGQTVLGWRDVPTDNFQIGDSAKAVEPVFRQIFVGASSAVKSRDELERKLYLIRRGAKTRWRIRISKRKTTSTFRACRQTRWYTKACFRPIRWVRIFRIS